MTIQLEGVLPALVTPFTLSGDTIDFESFGRLIELQLEAKVSGVVVCGSTGEAMTLSDDEYLAAVRFVAERVKGKVPCIAGISASATKRGVDVARVVREIGCDAVLVAAPPYNKPSQQGLLEHYRAIHRDGGLPVIAYNIPGRSGVAITPQTLGDLSREGTIVAVKESSGSLDTAIDVLRSVTSSCRVFSGEDSLVLGVLAYGGSGVISACANAFAHEFVALDSAFRAGDLEGARRAQMKLIPKIRAMFVESNPVPVKSLLALQKSIAHPTVRLPLVPLQASSLEVVKAACGV
jgi:4-hydroxy-tetrahydrodipicolinate synthase